MVLYAFFFSGRPKNVILLTQPGADIDGYLHAHTFTREPCAHAQTPHIHRNVKHVEWKAFIGIDQNT